MISLTDLIGELFSKMKNEDQAAEINHRFGCAPFRRKGATFALFEGECYATLGDGYRPLDTGKLVGALEEYINSNFPDSEVTHTEFNPEWTVIELTINSEELNERYSRALGVPVGGRRCKIVLQFRTSDTGWSAVNTTVCLKEADGAAIYVAPPIKVEHTGKASVKKYATELESLLPLMEEGAENLEALKSIDLNHPTKAFLNLCKKLGISQRKINESRARAVLESWELSGESQNALRLYRALGVVINGTKTKGVSDKVAETLQADILLKVLSFKKSVWEDLDRPTSAYTLEVS